MEDKNDMVRKWLTINGYLRFKKKHKYNLTTTGHFHNILICIV